MGLSLFSLNFGLLAFCCVLERIFSFPPPRQRHGAISADSIEARFENGRRNWSKEDSQNRRGKLSVPLCVLCGKKI
jgi:hypothetical protein